MKTSFISIVLFLIFITGYLDVLSQDQMPGNQANSMYAKALPSNQRQFDVIADNQSSFNAGNTDNPYMGTKGSMYYYDEWKTGKVVLSDNSVMDNVQLRYNIYAKQMQFTNGKDTLAFAKPEELKSITIEGKVFIYTEYKFGTETRSDYFEVVTDGRCKLLARRVVKYHKEIDENLHTCETDIFDKSCELYIKKGDSPAELVKCDKKSICHHFNDKQDLMQAFIMEHNMKIKTREDLAMLVEYYNSLESLVVGR